MWFLHLQILSTWTTVPGMCTRALNHSSDRVPLTGGHSACDKCGSCICRFCRLGQLCLECAQDSIFGPNLTNHAQPESIMRKALGLKGVAIPHQKAAYVAYYSYMSKNCFENELDNVKSPVLPSKSLLPSAG